MRSNSSDKKESGKRIPFLFYRELLPITLNYRKYKNEVILGFYDYLTIPEKALFYREIQTFLYFRCSPVYFRKNAPKCGKNLWVKIDNETRKKEPKRLLFSTSGNRYNNNTKNSMHRAGYDRWILVFLHSQNCISAIQALV